MAGRDSTRGSARDGEGRVAVSGVPAGGSGVPAGGEAETASSRESGGLAGPRARRRDPLATACSVLLGAMAALCLVEVLLRYGLGSSFGFYDELAGFLLVWLTFLGSVLARRDRAHIGVRDLVERLPRAPRLAAQLAEHGAMLLLHLVIAWFGAALALRFAAERAITMPIPMGLFYAVLPLAALLTAALEARSLLALLRRPRPDPGDGRPSPETAG